MIWTIVIEQYDRNKCVYENIDNIALAEPVLNTHAVLFCLHVLSGMHDLSLVWINLFKQFCFSFSLGIWCERQSKNLLHRETYFLIMHMKTTLFNFN